MCLPQPYYLDLHEGTWHAVPTYRVVGQSQVPGLSSMTLSPSIQSKLSELINEPVLTSIPSVRLTPSMTAVMFRPPPLLAVVKPHGTSVSPGFVDSIDTAASRVKPCNGWTELPLNTAIASNGAITVTYDDSGATTPSAEWSAAMSSASFQQNPRPYTNSQNEIIEPPEVSAQYRGHVAGFDVVPLPSGWDGDPSSLPALLNGFDMTKPEAVVLEPIGTGFLFAGLSLRADVLQDVLQGKGSASLEGVAFVYAEVYRLDTYRVRALTSVTAPEGPQPAWHGAVYSIFRRVFAVEDTIYGVPRRCPPGAVAADIAATAFWLLGKRFAAAGYYYSL